jgi:predicted translin family RNA/ssDNA-binding protein
MTDKKLDEIIEAIESLTDRYIYMVKHINELTEAVNINTEWRDQCQQEFEELEVLFEPDLDAFRDKSKDN